MKTMFNSKWYRVGQLLMYGGLIVVATAYTIFRYYEPAAVALLWALIIKTDMK